MPTSSTYQDSRPRETARNAPLRFRANDAKKSYDSPMSPRRGCAWVSLLLVGCGGEGPGEGFGPTLSPPVTSAPPGTDTSGGSTGDTTGPVGEASSSAADDTSTGTRYDVGTDQDVEPVLPPGCNDKIDFLFVIDRSFNPQNMQEKLVAAFPEFIATIKDKFSGFDVHIMVVKSDDGWGTPECEGPGDGCEKTGNNGCQATEEIFIPDYPCGYEDLAPCDDSLGAGVVFPAGWNASNRDCNLDDGKRYITGDQTDLEDTFTCMAQVGQDGGYKVGAALARTFHFSNTWKYGCNVGFLRDDALLMISLLAGIDGSGDDQTPELWADIVTAAKHGNKEAIVAFGITNVEGADGEDQRLRKFLKLFPYWHHEYISAPDYAPAFAEAVELVDVACQGFTPPA